MPIQRNDTKRPDAGNRMNTDHQQLALEYLRQQLAADTPAELIPEATFCEAPLENEGDTTVFRFNASIGGEPEQPFRVVAGQTVPNYYPSWNLTADQVYDLHVGTRFMLVMEVTTVPLNDLPADLPAQVTAFIGTVAPGETVNDITPVAAFGVENQVHAVCKARIADEMVYVLAMDCPPGIYRNTELPPHVIFRRHIGKLIRYEARADTSEKRKNRA